MADARIDIYIKITDGASVGPFTLKDVTRMVLAGDFNLNTEVLIVEQVQPGAALARSPQWEPWHQVPDLVCEELLCLTKPLPKPDEPRRL